VHVVTVNDYLASATPSGWAHLPLPRAGVGVNLSQMPHEEKQAAYAADITYGTNNEFGFDYLRDNMVYAASERVQRGLLRHRRRGRLDPDRRGAHAADHLRPGRGPHRPLCAHEPGRAAADPAGSEEKGEGDYWVDEKAHQVLLSEAGHEHAEEILARLGMLAEGSQPLRAGQHPADAPPLRRAARAQLFHRDQHYVVQNGEVVIVDEFTGRLMPGRRWSDGLHQAVEAKEGVKIQNENQTLASITFQNYFRMYGKLSGMTGTADTEAYEFHQIYGLETVVIPTNQPMIRKDRMDQVYRTAPEKHAPSSPTSAIATERGQPVLVGTTSIENSELLSGLLEKEKLPHQVLNAKQHAREARSSPRPAARHDHHRHQHGRPRHRHRARRQRREAGRSPAPPGSAPKTKEARIAAAARRMAGAARPGGEGRRPAHHRLPSATNRAASTTSCAAAPAARATRVPAASTCRWKIRCCASSPASASTPSWCA
jgi:preprotein translocase subunit SecA